MKAREKILKFSHKVDVDFHAAQKQGYNMDVQHAV